jgi:serine acetyltransferase
MENEVNISVIVTAYNYGRFISSCIESVLCQTYRYFEIVLVDDGSTDNTEQIIQKYKSLPFFKYIKQENKGQACAKNRGIRESHGDLIAFLDADDLWREDKLEKQVSLFQGHPDLGLVYSRAILIGEDSAFLDFRYSGKFLKPQRGSVTKWLFLDNFVWFSSCIVRRECFDRFGLFDETLKMGIDWDRWLRISVDYQFEYVDDDLLFYRHGHVGQMSKNIETRYECSDRIMKNFLDDYPGIVDRVAKNRAYYHTYCNRAEYYRRYDRNMTLKYLLKSVLVNPLGRDSYKVIAKILLNYDDVDAHCKFNRYVKYVKSDLHRYCGHDHKFFKSYLLIPGFRYTFWLRTARYLKNGSLLAYPFYFLSRFKLRSLKFRYGISIPYNVNIGKGFYVGHYGGIVINHEAVIGDNCNISQGVVLGATYGGSSPGVPKVGNNVYIGPGSILIGGIIIGDNVAIGSNAVINKTVPDNSVVVASPAKIVSHKGSSNYVINTDY